MSLLKVGLDQLAVGLRESESANQLADKWIGSAAGKIVSFEGPDEGFHLVFTRGSLSVRKGVYPSNEVFYQGTEAALVRVLRGELSAYAGARTGELRVWGNLNEATEFEKVLKSALTSKIG